MTERDWQMLTGYPPEWDWTNDLWAVFGDRCFNKYCGENKNEEGE